MRHVILTQYALQAVVLLAKEHHKLIQLRIGGFLLGLHLSAQLLSISFGTHQPTLTLSYVALSFYNKKTSMRVWEWVKPSRKWIEDWLFSCYSTMQGNLKRNVRFMVSSLGMPSVCNYYTEMKFSKNCGISSTTIYYNPRPLVSLCDVTDNLPYVNGLSIMPRYGTSEVLLVLKYCNCRTLSSPAVVEAKLVYVWCWPCSDFCDCVDFMW